MALSGLAAKTAARYNAQLLIELTNAGSSTATTISETIITNAATDISGEFQIYAAVVYDDADARHVAVGVEGVVMKLRLWMGQLDKAEEVQAKWRERVRDLARVTGRDRVVPTSTSPVIDSSELNPDGSAPLSRFDRSRFRPTIPGAPGGGQASDDDLP